MTKKDLINALEGLADDETVFVQVNYRTKRKDEDFDCYWNTSENVPISKVTIRDIPNRRLCDHRVADLHADVEIW